MLIELLLKAKEEELNSIIMELRRNYEASQEKCAKEQADKLVSPMEEISQFLKFNFLVAEAVFLSVVCEWFVDLITRKLWILLTERKRPE